MNFFVSLDTALNCDSISEYYGRWDHNLRIEIENTKLVESPKSILSLCKSNNRPLVELVCGTGRKVIRFDNNFIFISMFFMMVVKFGWFPYHPDIIMKFGKTNNNYHDKPRFIIKRRKQLHG
jgi:hypothetical protein